MLRDRVEEFIADGAKTEGIKDLLDSCVQDGSMDALICVRRLFEEMYGGMTFNLELKAPAAWALASWGAVGLDQLLEATLGNRTTKNVSLCIQVLSTIANDISGDPPFVDASMLERLKSRSLTDPTLSGHARRRLLELVLEFDDEEELLIGISTPFSLFAFQNLGAARELFAALSSRWLAISKPLLDEYEQLIADHRNDESPFQDFFTDHPQLLDPMVAEVWPQPDLRGAREPDFILRRFDNTYLVVEIETPAKKLVTKRNVIAASATHAVAQVSDYRAYIRGLSNLTEYFPGLDELVCLVVVGLEGDLSHNQRQALRNENHQRHSLRIVGFDWLAARARSVQGNLIRTGVPVRHARIT